MELVPVHNLYWRKYLTYGYHSLISLWVDEYGLPIYRDVVKIIHQAMVLKKSGVTILRFGNGNDLNSISPICFICSQ